MDKYSYMVPAGPRGRVTTAPARRAYVRSDAHAIGYVPYAAAQMPEPLPATLIAHYLPQFHPIPENDEWWGNGFTEWRNVTRTLPQFEGHAQPRLPGELGFYDLRDPEVMRKQVKLAREYGVGAFCFYFYWFAGKTLLEEPLRNWLRNRDLSLPFCLCWANEKWSRRWDGRGDDVLIDQQHSAEDDIAFIQHISEYLRDPRYLRIDGKPMLLLYRPGLLPNAAASAQRWRAWCRENGIGEIHLVYVQGFERPLPHEIGFDAAVEFPPNLSNPPSVSERQRLINREFSGEILDWRELVSQSLARDRSGYQLYPSVNPGWDNEARRSGKGRIYLYSSPRRYRDWLEEIVRSLADQPQSSRLVFVNAWNEWAEGAVLEPDARLGHAYLDATRQAMTRASMPPRPIKKMEAPCVVVHAWYLDVFDEIVELILATGIRWRLIVTTSVEHSEAVQARLKTLDMPSEIFIAQNKGRDILPFLHVADRLLNGGIDVVLKLHTKRSTHRADGDKWRKELTARLFGGMRAQAVLDAFIQQPDLGLVGPEGHIQPLDFYWGDNVDTVDYLTARLGIPEPRDGIDTFIPGSMFWVRLEALRPLLDAHLDESEFEPELGQTDGTFAHAIERVFGLCVKTAGFRVSTTAALLSQESGAESYPYAKRS